MGGSSPLRAGIPLADRTNTHPKRKRGEEVWKKLGSKKMLWERIRSFFREYIVYSMREILEALYYGYERSRPALTFDSP